MEGITEGKVYVEVAKVTIPAVVTGVSGYLLASLKARQERQAARELLAREHYLCRDFYPVIAFLERVLNACERGQWPGVRSLRLEQQTITSLSSLDARLWMGWRSRVVQIGDDLAACKSKRSLVSKETVEVVGAVLDEVRWFCTKQRESLSAGSVQRVMWKVQGWWKFRVKR